MKEQVYADPRPKEYFDRFHERARTHDPNFVYELVRLITSVYSYVFLRARAVAAEHVPESGAAILAPNHFSFMDHFLLGAHLRRKVRFMAKSQLFNGVAGWVYSRGGVFPVRRGARDDETFITAEAILARGGVVAMYCEGGRSRTGELQPRAKPGIGRLALESGVAVVPVAIAGSSKIRNWKRLRFPAVTVEYGAPLYFEREQNPSRERQQDVADAIFAEIKRLYAGLTEHRPGLRLPVSPQPSASQPVSPQPVSPQPVSPQPVSPKPVSPQSPPGPHADPAATARADDPEPVTVARPR